MKLFKFFSIALIFAGVMAFLLNGSTLVSHAVVPVQNATATPKEDSKDLTNLVNPLTGIQGGIATNHLSYGDIFSRIIINFLLGIVGTLSFVVFIIGGTTWLTSSGNPERVKKGKDMFVYALIGLAVTFSSYAVLRLVFQTLTA